MSKVIYLAGPMRGIPEFNFPAFFEAQEQLQKLGHKVFNPAERDNTHHGKDISKGNMTGDEQKAVEDHGFSLRDALAADTEFICKHADTIALLPGWENSMGAKAEKALSDALGLEVMYL